MKNDTWGKIALAAILLLELWAFSGSFDRFFNHDSLFYLIHPPRSWERFGELLARPDPTQQYRPLTLGAMSLALPLLGLDPRPYHWIPLVFHLLNTCLFSLLARRLLSDRLSVLAAVIFWGLHSVVAWVTYDIGYFPDFLMGFFSLGSLILAVDGFRRNSMLYMALALISYAAALLSKEAALALPLALLVCLVLAQLKNAPQPASYGHIPEALRRSAPLTCAYLVLALAHAARLVYWLQAGMLYAQGAAAAYDIRFFSNIAGKARYLYWALNLPDALSISHPNRNRAIALAMMGLLLLVWLADILRRRFRLTPIELGGVLWLIGTLAPAYLLSTRTAKWYLYMPVMGLALAVGSLAGSLNERLYRLRQGFVTTVILALFLAPVLFSSVVQTRSFLNSSDSAYASFVVRNCLQDFRELHPTLPPQVTLYLLPTFERNVAEFFGGGRLYSMFYPDSRIEMLFADKGDRIPSDAAARSDFWVLQYLYGHVYDVTGYYKGRRMDSCALRVIPELEKVKATVNRDEFYPSYEVFGTPNGKPVFFADPGKDIFTQIGGSVAVVSLSAIPAAAQLRMDLSWMHDQGDGGWAELSIRSDNREEPLFRKHILPNPKGRRFAWEEVRLDLNPYAGKAVELVLRCRNEAGNDTVADWLNWRDIRLESPELIRPDCRRPD